MGLQAKELNKLMAVLGNDRLVQVQVCLLYHSSLIDEVSSWSGIAKMNSRKVLKDQSADNTTI